jgi:ketosteroid isomerase-like protein
LAFGFGSVWRADEIASRAFAWERKKASGWSHSNVQRRNKLEAMSQRKIESTAVSPSEAESAAIGVAANVNETTRAIIENIYREWDDALSKLDVDRLLTLYAPDAILESPLVSHLLKTDRGVLHGRDELRGLLEELAKTQPETRRFYRKGYFTDGKTVIWEYPRESPGGDQQDFVEVMEIDNGLIKKHRVYWGWFGVRVLERGDHFRKKQDRVS